MFSPRERELDRGWPGRIEGERVIQLAAQTLEAFFTGGGTAREHDEFALGDVVLHAPVLRPPSVRLFADDGSFEFGNTASIFGPDAYVPWPQPAERLEARWCVAAVIGAEQAIGGFTLLNDWHAPALPPPKDRDFALSLGPWVATPETFGGGDFDWAQAVEHAARHTHLRPGDLLAAPPLETASVERGGEAALEHGALGRLRNLAA